MILAREELLRALESVEPGLSPKDTVEQSSCFALKGGEVHAFNEVMRCKAPSGLPADLTGAVHGKKLLNGLRKLTSQNVKVTVVKGHLRILAVQEGGSGKGDLVAVRMEAEIKLPIDRIEDPPAWNPLHESFGDAVSLVQDCCGDDEKRFETVCLHVHPRWVEAHDGSQAARYRMATGVLTDCAVEKSGMKHVAVSGVTEVGETASWLHFRSPSGLVMSCRRHSFAFRDLKPCFAIKDAVRLTLPKSLLEAVDLAEQFASEQDGERVLVRLDGERMTVAGMGVTGYSVAVRRAAYEGPAVTFYVPCKVLKGVAEKAAECVVSPTRLMIDGGDWRFVTCLSVAEVPDVDSLGPGEGE